MGSIRLRYYCIGLATWRRDEGRQRKSVVRGTFQRRLFPQGSVDKNESTAKNLLGPVGLATHIFASRCQNHRSLVDSDFAEPRMGMSGSKSFQSVRNFLWVRLALRASFCNL